MSGYKRGYMYADDPDTYIPKHAGPPEPDTPDWAVWIAGTVMFLLGLAVLGGCFGFIYSAMGPDPEPAPKPEKQIIYENYYPEGDDNGDGHIDETESGWNCETMGDEICGPDEHRMKLS